jgi:3-methylcrotonyl-CoA carboxylase alpha subunit
VAPGYHGADQAPQRLIEEAQRIGFPLIIKASAGGGGKGMQVVESAEAMAVAVESAQRVARAAFGDDRLLLERYFATARHVEVQVFADTQGGIVSLFDRDCSVQRRHQKVIEEAPAPNLREDVRAAMAQAAVTAARAVGYVGAGTVEFLVDDAQNFYFMEMNTRLQVEHPVTECITGIDLVEWQLRIAQGEALPLAQTDITQRGCAIEARLYAEDAAQGYLPSVGHITHLCWPVAADGLRVDAGVDAGDEVSTYYDPMLGKIIASGASRTAAIDTLLRGLRDLEVVGVTTNRPLLASVLGDPEFRAGAVATDFLERRHAHLEFGEAPADGSDVTLAAVWYAARRTAEDALWEDSRGWRLAAPPESRWRFAEGTALAECKAPGTYRVVLARAARSAHSERSERSEHSGRAHQPDSDGSHASQHPQPTEHFVRVLAREADSLRAECDGAIRQVRLIEAHDRVHLFYDGRHARLEPLRTEDALQASGGAEQGSLLTPLPGTIVAVHVSVGQQVTRGAPLMTVEAMKMEHTLTAPYDGAVSRIAFSLGDRVQAGAVLVELSGDPGVR